MVLARPNDCRAPLSTLYGTSTFLQLAIETDAEGTDATLVPTLAVRKRSIAARDMARDCEARRSSIAARYSSALLEPLQARRSGVG